MWQIVDRWSVKSVVTKHVFPLNQAEALENPTVEAHYNCIQSIESSSGNVTA